MRLTSKSWSDLCALYHSLPGNRGGDVVHNRYLDLCKEYMGKPDRYHLALERALVEEGFITSEIIRPMDGAIEYEEIMAYDRLTQEG